MTKVDVDSTLVFGTEPYEYQREIVEQTWQKPWWGLFMEMGTGKSKIFIDTVVNLYLAGRVDTVLYVSKKGELSNFQTYELPKHKPAHINCYAHVYRGYTKKDDLVKIKHMLTPTPYLRVLSINIESLRNQGSKPFAIAVHYLRSSKKCMIVVDESTTLKDRRSSQHKALIKLRKMAKYARIMTGTVMPNNPVDGFCQSLFLDKRALGYGGVTAFRNEYCEMEKQHFGSRSFFKMKGPKNLDQLQRKLHSIGTVLRKKDCLDLPEKVYTRSAVDLTPTQIEHYNNLVDYAVTKIDGEYIECNNALSVVLRLHQIVCGQMRMPDSGEYVLIDNNRYQAVSELVDEVLENEKKVVIWSHFKAASAGLAEYLRRNHELVHLKGGMNIEDRAEHIERFKTDPSCRIFLGNPQSSGFGLTLTEAHTAIYYSNSDNYEHRLQSEDRIHRIGQDTKCLYVDFHSPGTVEDAILERTKIKALYRDQVMGKNEFLELISLRQ